MFDDRPGDVPGSRRLGRLAPALMLLVFAAACGSDDGLDRRAISGEVTLDDRPLDAGLILFEPDAAGKAGTAVGAAIRRGRFSIPRHDGPVPGSYKVRIYASSGVQAPPDLKQSPRAPRPMVDLIPAQYNQQTVLAAKVSSDGANAFRFILISTPAPGG